MSFMILYPFMSYVNNKLVNKITSFKILLLKLVIMQNMI